MPTTHPEYDALYAAVCAAPEDDTARLVLADWLDEHDDPHRAAFIRAQVGLAQAREADPHAAAVFDAVDSYYYDDWPRYVDPAAISPGVGRIAELEKQAKKHERKAKSRWKVVLTRSKPGTISDYDRGFPHRVHILANQSKLYAAAAKADPAEPLPGCELSFEDPEDGPLLQAVSAGCLAGARGLRLGGSFSAEAVRQVGRSADVRNIRRLTIEAGDEPQEVIAAVAKEPNWSGLTHLRIADGEDTDLPAEFFRAKHFRSLVSLHLETQDVGGESLEALARMKWPHLRELDLSYNRADAVGVRTLAAGNFPELRSLNLTSNSFGDAGAAALAACRKLPKLAVLNLDGNRITDPKAVASLLAGPAFPALTILDLSFNHCKSLDAKALAAGGREPTLRALSLRYSRYASTVAGPLAACPALAGLVALDLGHNGLGDRGVKALVRHAKWDSLRALDLSSNGITAEGVKALADWPQLAKLAYLNLGGNPIRLAGAKILAGCAALKKCRKLLVPDGAHIPATGFALLKRAFGSRYSYGY